MDMSKKAYNSPERIKRRREGYSIFSHDYHLLKNKGKEVERDIESEKPRCPACSDCPMGVTGCDDDRRPHGHGPTQECQECGVPFYKVHPHSTVCPRGTPVVDDVRHDEYHMRHQLRWGVWFKNKYSKDIAEILVKEPSALEVLLILSDEGPKTVEQISNDIIYDTKVTDLLDKLKKLLLVDVNNDMVNITYHGKFVVRKCISGRTPL